MYVFGNFVHLFSCISCAILCTVGKEAYFMPLRYKLDVINALKEKGISTYTMRKEKILSESTIQKLRQGQGVGWENIEILCKLLECQPADLIEYVSDLE